VAYDAASGSEIWVRRYAPGGLYSGATDAAVSPDGNRVYVTGFSPSPGTSNDYATLAYRAGDGKRLWESRFDYAPEGYDKPHAIAADSGGELVFVTGESGHLGEQTDYLTLALDAGTGALTWTARLGGPAGGNDVARDIAVSPTGGAVYLTGESWGTEQPNYLTAAYDAGTGSLDWLAPYGTAGGFDSASALALGRGALFITGASEGPRRLDFATISYNTG
jgi:DNA-binding beta-propeller fold protein YncE